LFIDKPQIDVNWRMILNGFNANSIIKGGLFNLQMKLFYTNKRPVNNHTYFDLKKQYKIKLSKEI